jgi:hypothetical protein
VDIVASSAEMENGILVVYYSTAFPKYAHQRSRYEQRDAGLAGSFTTRYEIWLAAHSLLIYQDQQSEGGDGGTTFEEENPEIAEAQERQERVRMATVAALFATREVELGASETETAIATASD